LAHRVAILTRAAALAFLFGTAGLALVGTRSAVASVLHRALLAPAAIGGGLGLWIALRRRDRTLGAAAVAALAAAGLTWAGRVSSAARPDAAAAGGGALDVVSYNVLFRGGSPRATLAVLRAEHADVLCLQEVTPAWRARLDAALGAEYPHSTARPHAGTHGLAIYSRFPIDAVADLDDDAGRAIARCVRVRGRPAALIVCDVHLASPAALFREPLALVSGFEANAARRLRQWRALRALVRERYPGIRHLVVAGDLNTLPEDPLYEEARRDLVDAWAEAGSGPAATFPAGVPFPPRPVVRLDYVLASPSLAAREARVVAGGGSDHRAVRARLALPAADPVRATGASASSGPAAGEGDPPPR
jgi:endonuclease/exonuclease/phosphatase family metal-dependent hydrolase